MKDHSIVFRRYCMVTDFQKVYDLCARCGNMQRSNGMPASFWEYAQTFGSFQYEYSHRIGLWEDNGRLVAVATYEVSLGEAFFAVDPDYLFLSEELIQYAQREFKDEEGDLCLCFSNAQTVMRETAEKLGFVRRGQHPEKIYQFKNGLLAYELPDGFRFLDHSREAVDYVKLDTCLHYGFDHDGEPDGDTDFRIHMYITPNFNPRLPVIAIEESTGEYAGYANAFVEKAGQYAYLEPLCTQPKYRKMGIAAAIISEMIRRVMPLGAKYITGGSSDFYTAIGYEISYYNEYWKMEGNG